MAMQAQDRRDASETLFIRVGSGHGHLQTACAMLEGWTCFVASHRVSPGGLAAGSDLAHLRVLHHEKPLLIIVGIRAEITDMRSKDEM